MEENYHNIIIDNGSYYIKAGLSGEEEPRTIFRSLIGYPKNKDCEINFLVGCDAEAKSDRFNLNYPIEYGAVKNWDEMEKFGSIHSLMN